MFLSDTSSFCPNLFSIPSICFVKTILYQYVLICYVNIFLNIDFEWNTAYFHNLHAFVLYAKPTRAGDKIGAVYTLFQLQYKNIFHRFFYFICKSRNIPTSLYLDWKVFLENHRWIEFSIKSESTLNKLKL